MKFEEYRSQLLRPVIENSGTTASFEALFASVAQMIKARLGFDIEVRPKDDPDCPFDIWGMAQDTLYLISVDKDLFWDFEGEIGAVDANRVIASVWHFVNAAASSNGISDLQNTRGMIAEAISRLAHGDTNTSIKNIKILGFVFNAADVTVSTERSYRANLLKFTMQVISLYSLWQHGIALPAPAQEFSSESKTNGQDVTPLVNEGSQQDGPESVNFAQENRSADVQAGDANIFDLSETEEVGSVRSTQDEKEFREMLINEAQSNTGLTSYNLYDAVIDILQEDETYDEIVPAHCGIRSYGVRKFAVDGWGLDETNNTLSLYLLDPEYSSSGNFGKADLETLSKYVINFVELSAKGVLADRILDYSTEEGNLAYQIEQAYKDPDSRYNRINVVLLTMRRKVLRNAMEETTCAGVTCRITAIDYRDLHQLNEASAVAELEIDFTDPKFGAQPLPMISAVDRPGVRYKAYVGKMRADVLSGLYEEYGQRILAANVRAFLMTAGKVNREMQKTIKNEPDKFFAYNNGICVVAAGISSEERTGISLINKARDFQIVNGGQTTASLHYAKKHGIRIDNIFVQMKLSVVPYDSDEDGFERQQFVQNISRYANSQNKVTDSDLGTNTQFQIKFEQACRKSGFFSDGNLCYWYYERARGTYKVEKNKAQQTKSKAADFAKRYPQKFDKTELAKWIKSWGDEPQMASVGAQKCFFDFSRDLDKKEKTDGLDFCTTDFFKYAVGKGILYRHIDLQVAASQWYQEQRSYKINIVGYTMGLLRKGIDELFPGCELDFKRVWATQRAPGKNDKIKTFDPLSHGISAVLDPITGLLAKHARAIFDDERRPISDVGEWVKKAECWKMMKDEIPSLEQYREQLRPLVCPVPESYQIRSWRGNRG